VATETTSPPAPGLKPHHRRRNLVLVSVVVIVVVFVVLFAIPFSMPFSIRTNSYYENVLSVPAGSHVTGSFSTNNSDKVDFVILGTGNVPLYQSESDNGSFTVTPSSADVTIQINFFGQDCTVDVSGTYTAPIVWITSFPIP